MKSFLALLVMVFIASGLLWLSHRAKPFPPHLLYPLLSWQEKLVTGLVALAILGLTYCVLTVPHGGP